MREERNMGGWEEKGDRTRGREKGRNKWMRNRG
jgi:hypothetical protein